MVQLSETNPLKMIEDYTAYTAIDRQLFVTFFEPLFAILGLVGSTVNFTSVCLPNSPTEEALVCFEPSALLR